MSCYNSFKLGWEQNGSYSFKYDTGWQVVHFGISFQNQSCHPWKATIHSKPHWITNWCQQSFIFWAYSFYYWALSKEISNRQTNGPFHILWREGHRMWNLLFYILSRLNHRPGKSLICLKITIWSVLESWILGLQLMNISVVLRKTIQQMQMKGSQNLGVKQNVLLLPWYPNCSKEALLDQHCWSQLVCLILMFCRANCSKSSWI